MKIEKSSSSEQLLRNFDCFTFPKLWRKFYMKGNVQEAVDELGELRAGDLQIVDLVSGASVSTTDARGCILKKLKRESDWEFRSCSISS